MCERLRTLPLAPVPLTYDHAFGGGDTVTPDVAKRRIHLGNLVGCGFHGDAPKAAIIDQPLPQLEAVDDPVRDPGKEHRAAALGVVGRTWLPRRSYAGTYDDAWNTTRAPLLPKDFDPRFFQSVPADQQIPLIRPGSEPVEVRLDNLRADGEWVCHLPVVSEPVEVFPYRGAAILGEMVTDTVILEPDERRITFTARATLDLPFEYDAIERVMVGPVSRGWRLARRLGKRWSPMIGAPA